MILNGKKHPVQAVVFRHGTHEIVRKLLAQWEVSAADIQAIERKWRNAWIKHGHTADEPLPGINHDTQRRATAWHLRPSVAGRTPIGMLSRFVAQFDPGMIIAADESLKLADLPTDLVSDLMARMVTPSEVTPSEDRTQIQDRLEPWALAGRIPQEKVVAVIRAIDVSLGTLVEDPAAIAQHHGELEHHWVLPRCGWMATPRDESALLVNTFAARCWQGRTLRYVPRGEHTRETLSLGLPGDPNDLIVVDLETEPARVALATADTSENRRLALQLGATYLKIPSGYIELTGLRQDRDLRLTMLDPIA